ncbi:DUF427 domain-containing protein [Actinoplanes auranticolor]|uniref:DUF427 domain-containing protein n=1 Tax=Actinoplanes auranticolor TaxID=47988 RepID=A0A919VY03_9ACTN|nr:DUF427 domain-containing protein [Actinoplanes auranticolor]GIM79902.1 hypothetical protein Aau02nite_88020 [Actinoplanes auranticolor]
MGYPGLITPVGHREPVPRRIRGVLGGRVVLDTTRAVYVWEWPPYPRYYVPAADLAADVLVDEDHEERLPLGTARRVGLRSGEVTRTAAGHVHTGDSVPELAGLVRLEWAALDAWFEEDEEVFVHPRNPYARVDALRSTRHVLVELDGVPLAESATPVVVFETGLPPRYYLPRTAVDFTHLEPSATVTACPYKGRTTGYWSVRAGGTLHPDLAWSYDFPTRELLPIAGLVSFYNEKVDLFLDGEPVERPHTPFSPEAQ